MLYLIVRYFDIEIMSSQTPVDSCLASGGKENYDDTDSDGTSIVYKMRIKANITKKVTFDNGDGPTRIDTFYFENDYPISSSKYMFKFTANKEHFDDDGNVTFKGIEVLNDFIKETEFPNPLKLPCMKNIIVYEVDITIAKIVAVRIENLRDKWIASQKRKIEENYLCAKCGHTHNKTSEDRRKCANRVTEMKKIVSLCSKCGYEHDRTYDGESMCKRITTVKTGYVNIRNWELIPKEIQDDMLKDPYIKEKVEKMRKKMNVLQDCRHIAHPDMCPYYRMGTCKFRH